jgi:hypothetical protein
MDVGGCEMNSSCIEAFRRFVEEALGRLSFEELARRFKEGLAENPVFSEIEKSGALGKNVIIILGGRGCGKTLLLRYIKYRLESDGWVFKYINGTEFVKPAKEQAEKMLQNIIAEEESKLSGETATRLAVAIDDVAEAVEIAADFLKKQVELAKKYEGRFKLILATQSERPGTLILLRKTLPEAPFAEMFFGEDPKESIVGSFKTSYIAKRTVALFRGAALINLDAYWSSMRDLDRVEDLAEAIVKIAEFYARNAPTYCSDAVKLVSEVKHGLALIALSTTPKIIDDQDVTVIIEYGREKDGALNGLGIAELLTKLFAESEIRDIALEAEKTYSVLKAVEVKSIDTDNVEEALLEMAPGTGYMTALENIPVKSIVPIQLQPSTATTKPAQQAGKPSRRYGPRVNAIEVKLERSGREITRYIILVSLKTDRRGYIATSSIEKIRKLVELKVPSKAEERYLVVIVPTWQDIAALHKALGPEHMKKKGVDVLPIFTDELSGLEKAFILHTINRTLPAKFQSIAPKILAGTLLLSLRGERGTPHLAYLMLPYVA